MSVPEDHMSQDQDRQYRQRPAPEATQQTARAQPLQGPRQTLPPARRRERDGLAQRRLLLA